MSLKYKIGLFLTLLLLSIAFLLSLESEFEKKWNTVKIGENSQSAVATLGEPYRNQSEFSYWIMDPHENEAADAGSVYFMTWLDGIDTLYIAGLNEENEIVYKIRGGS